MALLSRRGRALTFKVPIISPLLLKQPALNLCLMAISIMRFEYQNLGLQAT
jgi:hypothetical protein